MKQGKLLKINDLVLVPDFRGVKKKMVVVDFGGKEGEILYLCTEEELQKARSRGLEPVCIGIRRRYIVVDAA
jgi:hypothetical protein